MFFIGENKMVFVFVIWGLCWIFYFFIFSVWSYFFEFFCFRVESRVLGRVGSRVEAGMFRVVRRLWWFRCSDTGLGFFCVYYRVTEDFLGFRMLKGRGLVFF